MLLEKFIKFNKNIWKYTWLYSSQCMYTFIFKVFLDKLIDNNQVTDR